MKRKEVVLVNPANGDIQLAVTLLIDPSLDKGSNVSLEKFLVLPRSLIDKLQLSKIDRIGEENAALKFGSSFYGFVKLKWDDKQHEMIVLVGEEGVPLRISRDLAASMIGVEMDRNWWAFLVSSPIALVVGYLVAVFLLPWVQQLGLPSFYSVLAQGGVITLILICLTVTIGGPIMAFRTRAGVRKFDAYFDKLEEEPVSITS
jgi:hypothetical protein